MKSSDRYRCITLGSFVNCSYKECNRIISDGAVVEKSDDGYFCNLGCAANFLVGSGRILESERVRIRYSARGI